MRISRKLCLVLAAVLIAGCVKEEPGPAEQIGKGFDQMFKGMQKMGDDSAAARREEQERRARERTRYDDRPYADQAYGDLDSRYDDRGLEYDDRAGSRDYDARRDDSGDDSDYRRDDSRRY